jgi:hypothetical protein
MKTKQFLFSVLALVSLIVGFSSCSNDDNTNPTTPIKKEVFKGYVQKGPYVNGSSITITQLDQNLNQTGKVFSTQIIDNAGTFEQKNIEFTSNFIELKAEGYYFNEVKGEVSSGPLTLYALADVSDVNSVNVNILTHLERQRMMYLIQNDKLSFSEAKQQARSEVLNIFKLTLPETISTESLNIADDALLLAVSAIIQGHLSTGNMAELLANISSDIRTDGKLDNSVLGSQLINNAAYLDLKEVQANLVNKYSTLGVAMYINTDDLNNYVQQFINNSEFAPTLFISYPERGRDGLNILNENFVEARATGDGLFEYSVTAIVPKGNSSLKIIIKAKSTDSSEQPWGGYYPSTQENWQIEREGSQAGAFICTVIESGKPCDLTVTFTFDTIIEYYENGATVPTKVKEIKVIR